MQLPTKLKIINAVGPVVGRKDGKDYCFAEAEQPSEGSTHWSTIRWKCVVQSAVRPSWMVVGKEVAIQVTQFDGRGGEGSFDVVVPQAAR